jgi:hypothetical protein
MPIGNGNYNPTPPRLLSKVQDRSTFETGNGNILHYKKNINLSQNQRYSHLAKGFGPSITKIFAIHTQSEKDKLTSQSFFRPESKRYAMNNSGTKYPEDSKGFVNELCGNTTLDTNTNVIADINTNVDTQMVKTNKNTNKNININTMIDNTTIDSNTIIDTNKNITINIILDTNTNDTNDTNDTDDENDSQCYINNILKMDSRQPIIYNITNSPENNIIYLPSLETTSTKTFTLINSTNNEITFYSQNNEPIYNYLYGSEGKPFFIALPKMVICLIYVYSAGNYTIHFQIY